MTRLIVTDLTIYCHRRSSCLLWRANFYAIMSGFRHFLENLTPPLQVQSLTDAMFLDMTALLFWHKKTVFTVTTCILAEKWAKSQKAQIFFSHLPLRLKKRTIP